MKILLIAGYFPPVRISTGSIRIWNIAWYLDKNGWDVTVLTPKIEVWDSRHIDQKEKYLGLISQSGIKVIYTGHWFKFLSPNRYGLAKNKVSWFFGGIFRKVARFFEISDWLGWVPACLIQIPSLKRQNFDLIFATGAPFYGFLIANLISRMLKIPYIIDYRDLWSNNPWYPPKRKWITKLENMLIKESAGVTAVSPLSAEMLAQSFGYNEKIAMITNGYEKELLNNVSRVAQNKKIILFAGMLFPPRLTLNPVFDVIRKYKAELFSQELKFVYFGPNHEMVRSECYELGISEFWEIYDQVGRAEILKLEKTALYNIILSSSSVTPTVEELGHIPGKVFELIGLDASLLPIVPNGSSVEEILTGMGVKTFDPSEIDSIYKLICEEIPNLAYGHERYSWENLIQKFIEVFTQMIAYRD